MQGKLLTFQLGEVLFGTDITRIKEINRNTEFTPVPGSIEMLVGVVNLRGNIVTLVDLKKMLEIREGVKAAGLCLVLKPGPEAPDLVGFLIDRTGDVIDVEEHYCEAAPATFQGFGAYLVSEVFKQKECLIPIIDISALFQLLDEEAGWTAAQELKDGDTSG